MPKTTKKSVSRTTAVKKPVVHKKTVAKAAKTPVVRSFRLCRESQPFMSTSPTVQSIYWLIIGVLVLIFVAWAMALTAQVQAIYDTVMMSETASYTITK